MKNFWFKKGGAGARSVPACSVQHFIKPDFDGSKKAKIKSWVGLVCCDTIIIKSSYIFCY